MNQYEVMYVIDPTLDDGARVELINRFSELVKKNGGEVDRVDEWGKRRLAYPIMKQPEGYYTLINFKSSPEFTAELDRIYNITEGVLRSIIVKKEEHKAKPQKARKAPVATEAPAQEAKAEEPAADAE